jgi:hypothetical protein
LSRLGSTLDLCSRAIVQDLLRGWLTLSANAAYSAVFAGIVKPSMIA